MGLSIITPPTVWPVTLEEAKAQVRVRHDDEDAYLTSLIKAATRYVERTLSLSIAAQTWKLTLDSFSDYIELPRGPVTAVTGIEYVDEAGETQTASEALYTTDLSSSRQWIVRNSDATWPDVIDGVNAVSITYAAGMDLAPDDLKHAILLLIGHFYANREAATDKPVVEVPLAVDALLQTYRTVLV